MKVKDVFTLSMISSKAGMLIQDLIAPFHTFLKAEYEMEYLKMGDVNTGSNFELKSTASVRTGKKLRKSYEFRITIRNNRIEKIYITTPTSKLEATWEEAEY